jgi:hypothetical protein
MRTHIITLVAVGLAAVATPAAGQAGTASAAVHGAAASTCRGPDDRTAGLIAYLTDLMTATDSTAVFGRDSVYHVPVVPTNEIHLVTDAHTCARAARAYGRQLEERGRANKDRRVYVIQLGTHDPHYLVLAPEEMAGEHHMIFIFDRTFKLTGGWTG